MRLIHSAVSPFFSSGSRSCSTVFASPRHRMSGRISLPNSAASMSIWIFTAFLQNWLGTPRMRSSSRAPTEIIRSHSTTARLAKAVPCMPSPCRLSLWESGNTPLPSSVVATGACSVSASCRSSFSARESTAPWPAMITGRWLFASASAICWIVSGA